MDTFSASEGRAVVMSLIKTIQDNAAYLSEIDGAIGDGDHGINMNKGFSMVERSLPEAPVNLADGLSLLGDTLLTEIGGSMGPLYGMIFMDMGEACQGKAEIDGATFGAMLRAALDAVQSLGDAKVGDKTLVDTLVPALEAYEAAMEEDADFVSALTRMMTAAEAGKESTRDLVAKIGRASRLGERSRGHLDPGATSCYLLLEAFADSVAMLLRSSESA